MALNSRHTQNPSPSASCLSAIGKPNKFPRRTASFTSTVAGGFLVDFSVCIGGDQHSPNRWPSRGAPEPSPACRGAPEVALRPEPIPRDRFEVGARTQLECLSPASFAVAIPRTPFDASAHRALMAALPSSKPCVRSREKSPENTNEKGGPLVCRSSFDVDGNRPHCCHTFRRRVHPVARGEKS